MLGLLSEGVDAFLDVGVVHVLDVAENWNDEALKREDEHSFKHPNFEISGVNMVVLSKDLNQGGEITDATMPRAHGSWKNGFSSPLVMRS